MNPLFQQMNSNGADDILKRFQQFRSQFQGNPQAIVQEMLRTGRITQAQYDEAVRAANRLSQFIK